MAIGAPAYPPHRPPTGHLTALRTPSPGRRADSRTPPPSLATPTGRGPYPSLATYWPLTGHPLPTPTGPLYPHTGHRGHPRSAGGGHWPSTGHTLRYGAATAPLTGHRTGRGRLCPAPLPPTGHLREPKTDLGKWRRWPPTPHPPIGEAFGRGGAKSRPPLPRLGAHWPNGPHHTGHSLRAGPATGQRVRRPPHWPPTGHLLATGRGATPGTPTPTLATDWPKGRGAFRVQRGAIGGRPRYPDLPWGPHTPHTTLPTGWPPDFPPPTPLTD